MLKFFRRKKSDSTETKSSKEKKAKQTLDKELAKESARKQNKNEDGPNYPALITFLVIFGLGTLLWLWQLITSGEDLDFNFNPSGVTERESEDNVIIIR